MDAITYVHILTGYIVIIPVIGYTSILLSVVL